VIPREGVAEAEDGDLVMADVLPTTGYGPARAQVRERLGSPASERAISLIAIHAHSIPHVFPNAVMAEAERLLPALMEAGYVVTDDEADGRP